MTLKDARTLCQHIRDVGPPDLRPTVPLGHGPDGYFVRFWDLLVWQTGYLDSPVEWEVWARRYNAELARRTEHQRAFLEAALTYHRAHVVIQPDAEGRFAVSVPWSHEEAL